MYVFVVEFVLSSNVTHIICLIFLSFVLNTGCIWDAWKTSRM